MGERAEIEGDESEYDDRLSVIKSKPGDAEVEYRSPFVSDLGLIIGFWIGRRAVKGGGEGDVGSKGSWVLVRFGGEFGVGSGTG